MIIKVSTVSEFSTVKNILLKLGGYSKMFYDDIEYLKTLKLNHPEFHIALYDDGEIYWFIGNSQTGYRRDMEYYTYKDFAYKYRNHLRKEKLDRIMK